MADKDVRTRDCGAIEQRLQFFNNVLGCARHGAEIAPAEAGAVVADNAVGPGEFSLEAGPAEDRGHEAGFEQYRWAAVGAAGFEQMQAVGADVDQAAGWRMDYCVAPRAEGLIEPAQNRCGGGQAQ